jgi:succinyl-CoA synthetase alpha subunit
MTWPTLDQQTAVLIQGMGGKEGTRMARWMMASGIRVVAGVNPGQGGTRIEDRPIYETVADAVAAHPDAAASCIVVPPKFVLAAVREALAAGIRVMNVLTENIPVHDVLTMRREARAENAWIFGPSSVGVLVMPGFRMGFIGGENPFSVIREGSLALISVSGGMSNELLVALSRAGVGIRLVVAIGGDRVTGMLVEEAIAWAESRHDVDRIALFIEPGNPLLAAFASGEIHPSKPTVILLPGNGMEAMPRGLPYGHTGTILGEDAQKLADVRAAILRQGTVCTDSIEQFINSCKSAS